MSYLRTARCLLRTTILLASLCLIRGFLPTFCPRRWFPVERNSQYWSLSAIIKESIRGASGEPSLPLPDHDDQEEESLNFNHKHSQTSSSDPSFSLYSQPPQGFSSDREPKIPEFKPSEKLEIKRPEKMNVGNPQILVDDKDFTVTDILRELAAIRQEGPQKYCILGTRHCSYLHQQIVELLAYALVLSGNHVFTSGSMGTNAAAVRGALRADNQDLLTVVLPQSMEKQTSESQELLEKVNNVIAFPERDDMSLEMASKLCNSFLLNQTDQLISFAFHESSTVIEAAEEAKELQKLVTMLFLD